MRHETVVDVMGLLIERPGRMAIVDGIGKGKPDLLGHVNAVLRRAGRGGLSEQALNEEVRRLIRSGIAFKADQRLELTERGSKAWAILRYGAKWREKDRHRDHGE